MINTLAEFLRQTTSWLRLGCFLALLVLLWLPQVALILWSTGWQWGLDPTNLQNTLGAVGLYLSFIALLGIFSRIDGKPFSQYGWRADAPDWGYWLLGLGTGLGGLAVLFSLEALWGWLVFTPEKLLGPTGIEIMLTGVGVGLAVAGIEELLFRGFLINIWLTPYGKLGALWTSALIFAIAHFLKPLEAILASWPQFPGLIIMGLLLGGARFWTGDRLGLGMGLHGGWVAGIYWVNVGGLISYTGAISSLWTGINGNPLASLLGLFFLGLTAIIVRLLTVPWVLRA